MRKALSKREIRKLISLADKLEDMRYALERNDVTLHFGNGLSSEQVSCAVGSLDCILQEYDLDTLKLREDLQ